MVSNGVTTQRYEHLAFVYNNSCGTTIIETGDSPGAWLMACDGDLIRPYIDCFTVYGLPDDDAILEEIDEDSFLMFAIRRYL